MLTAIVIAALALIAFIYVAIPLLLPDQVDPLPDQRDSVLVDLAEEKTALLRAIRELDNRADLPLERRRLLHQRYEAKAAKVIVAIDEREATLASRGRKTPAPSEAPAKRRVPIGAVVVLGLVIGIAALVPSNILPRIGRDSTVTTTDLDLAQQLQAQQRAAQAEPNATNLLALGDTYLGLQQPDDAEKTYMQLIETVEPVPATAYQRMAVINLQRDLGEAQRWLTEARRADANDPDTLFLLGEVAWAQGDLEVAHSAFSDFVATSAGSEEPEARDRLLLLDELLPLQRAVDDEQSLANLLALGDAYWQAGEPQRALQSYFLVLTEIDPLQPLALSRTGEVLYMAGRASDAVGALERAASAVGGVGALEPSGARTLADAYLELGEWSGAAAAYSVYIGKVGAEAAGNAPQLLAAAEARASGDPDAIAATDSAFAQLTGQQVFSARCVECHGPSGEGGLGVRLAGSSRAANRGNVDDAVRFGRGMMPGFLTELEESDLNAVVSYVVEVLAPRP